MTCSRCHKQNSSSGKYCGFCGETLSVSKSSEPDAAIETFKTVFVWIVIIYICGMIFLHKSETERMNSSTAEYTPYFDGNPCKTADCAGHEAGSNWAKEEEITNPALCDTGSSSFNEGCASRVEINQGIQSWSRE